MSEFDAVLNSEPQAFHFPRVKVANALARATDTTPIPDCDMQAEPIPVPTCIDGRLPPRLGNDMNEMLRRSAFERTRTSRPDHQ